MLINDLKDCLCNCEHSVHCMAILGRVVIVLTSFGKGLTKAATLSPVDTCTSFHALLDGYSAQIQYRTILRSACWLLYHGP